MFDDNYDYYEPSVGDEIYLEAREKLINSLKDSVKQHIESVSIENEKLKSENSKLKESVRDITRREKELEGEKLKYKKDIRFERLSELMNDLRVIIYEVTYFNELAEKCNKCDDKREIHYTTPMGRKTAEKCECATQTKKYIVEEKILHEFRYGNNNTMLMWFNRYNTSNGGDGYGGGSAIEVFYDNYEHEDIPSYQIHFRNKENAERHCEWLNRKGDTIYERI